MADLTSQPSLNAFCAAMEGDVRDPGVQFMQLEPLDIWWMKVRRNIPLSNILVLAPVATRKC